MKNPRERILVVESDPDIIDLVTRQTLQAIGYKVEVSRAVASAIQDSVRFAPDLVIANLELPGLSGKDLLVALNAQGWIVPVIVIARKGMEADIIQAFRLGAEDYLLWPLREAEIVTAVERVLKQVRARRERETLERQLKHTNDEMQQRVRELTTIYALGKAVTSITNQQDLFEKIVEGSVYVTEADSGWLLIREDEQKPFILSAQRNLPAPLTARLGQPWDDGLSSLVALSGETLSINGEPLMRFKISQLSKAALVAPVKLKKEVVGLLVVTRREDRPFNTSNRTLLESVADYASISLVNARLFRALQDRARSLQQVAEQSQANERNKDEIIMHIQNDLGKPLAEAIQAIDGLLIGENTRLNAVQKGVLRTTQDKLKEVTLLMGKIHYKRSAS